MKRRRRYPLWITRGLWLMAGLFLLIACQQDAPTQTTTITVTRLAPETIVEVETVVNVVVDPDPAASPTSATAVPRRSDLIICLPEEPATLYKYAATSAAETAVLHALYENDFTTLSYGYQAQGLEKLPRLDDSDARINEKLVGEGQTVLNAAGEIGPLAIGMLVYNMAGELVSFDGTPLVLPQMVVDFRLKARVWADGTAVTAADSVYSYELAHHPGNPSGIWQEKNRYTANYEAIGPRQTRWTGLPGYLDRQYFTNFWPPLPRHAWQGIAPQDLPVTAVASRKPLGDGPFTLVDWVAGDYIQVKRNPAYYRAGEGLPRLETITFRFLTNQEQLITELLTGNCDIAPQAAVHLNQAEFFLAASANSAVDPTFSNGTVYEIIAFGINSWGNYGDGKGRPDWFEDVGVRQAMTLCTDRQQMVDTLLFGRSQLIHTYVPDKHPLHDSATTVWPYDVAAANQLLDDAGFSDNDGDGVREDPATGQPFLVTLGTSATNMLEQQLTSLFQQNMLDCGIAVSLYYLTPQDLLADGPDGPLFGRQFDLAQLAWPVGDEPLCRLYISGEITGPAEQTFPDTGQLYAGWQGLNATGWWSTAYDTACQTAVTALPGTAAYETAHRQALNIFAQNLPAIPLFPRIKMAITHQQLQNFTLDPTQPSEFWNIYELIWR